MGRIPIAWKGWFARRDNEMPHRNKFEPPFRDNLEVDRPEQCAEQTSDNDACQSVLTPRQITDINPQECVRHTQDHEILVDEDKHTLGKTPRGHNKLP